MNKIVERLLEHSADWPEEAQAELVKSIVEIENRYFGASKPATAQQPSIRDARAQPERGVPGHGAGTSGQEIAPLFDRYGL